MISKKLILSIIFLFFAGQAVGRSLTTLFPYRMQNLLRITNRKLMFAVHNNKLDRVKKLIDRGANVNARDFYGLDLLHSAAWWGHEEVVLTLVERGANVKESVTDYLLHRAAVRWHKARLRVMDGRVLSPFRITAENTTPPKHIGLTDASVLKQKVEKIMQEAKQKTEQELKKDSSATTHN